MEMDECHLYTFMEYSTGCILRGRPSWSLWNRKIYTSI